MPAPKGVARPEACKLTERKRADVLRLVLAGATIDAAAHAVGCSCRTLYRHAERDQLFRWRLRVARDVRDRLRRQAALEQHFEADLIRYGFQVLGDTLRCEWGMGRE